jgi:hypothetical protein
VAVKAVMETVRDEEVAGLLNPVTVGGVASVEGIVTVTEALRLLETFPAASLAQAKRVLVPAVANE